MAKKDKSKAGDKTKPAKKIAGIKVPKVLRKGGIGTFFDSPLGRQMLADALVAAAAAAAAVLVRHRPTGEQIGRAGDAVADAGAGAATGTRDAVKGVTEAVTSLAIEAARHLLPASTDDTKPRDEGGGKGYDHLAERDPKGKKEKNRSKSSEH